MMQSWLLHCNEQKNYPPKRKTHKKDYNSNLNVDIVNFREKDSTIGSQDITDSNILSIPQLEQSKKQNNIFHPRIHQFLTWYSKYALHLQGQLHTVTEDEKLVIEKCTVESQLSYVLHSHY